jgi:hypothetical protein
MQRAVKNFIKIRKISKSYMFQKYSKFFNLIKYQEKLDKKSLHTINSKHRCITYIINYIFKKFNLLIIYK